MPYGAGSMQMRRRCWWLVYKNASGHVVQENAGTDNAAKARRMLTERAPLGGAVWQVALPLSAADSTLANLRWVLAGVSLGHAYGLVAMRAAKMDLSIRRHRPPPSRT